MLRTLANLLKSIPANISYCLTSAVVLRAYIRPADYKWPFPSPLSHPLSVWWILLRPGTRTGENEASVHLIMEKKHSPSQNATSGHNRLEERHAPSLVWSLQLPVFLPTNGRIADADWVSAWSVENFHEAAGVPSVSLRWEKECCQDGWNLALVMTIRLADLTHVRVGKDRCVSERCVVHYQRTLHPRSVMAFFFPFKRAKHSPRPALTLRPSAESACSVSPQSPITHRSVSIHPACRMKQRNSVLKKVKLRFYSCHETTTPGGVHR